MEDKLIDITNETFNNLSNRYDLDIYKCTCIINTKADILNYTDFISWYGNRLYLHKITKKVCDLFPKGTEVYLYAYPLDHNGKYKRGTYIKTKIKSVSYSDSRPFYIEPFGWVNFDDFVGALRLDVKNIDKNWIIKV